MAISGIGLYPGFQGGIYSARDIKQVDVETVRAQDKVEKSKENIDLNSAAAGTKEVDEKRAHRVAALQDISLTFQKENEFDQIGRDANIQNLDMQKAISVMQKDSILSQYQYFVGGKGEALEAGLGILQSASEDGLVFAK